MLTIGTAVEHMGPDQTSEGDHDAELGAGGDDVVDSVSGREPELHGGCFDRARRRGCATTAPAIGLADDEHDLVAGVVQRPQRRHCDGGGAEEDEALRQRQRKRRRRRCPLGAAAAFGCSAMRRYSAIASRRWSGVMRSNINTPLR